MQPKVELKQIRDLGQVVDDSILFFKQNFKPLLKAYFTICGAVWLAETVIGIINQIQTTQRLQSGESFFSVIYFITVFFSFLNSTLLVLTTLSYIAIYRDKGKETPLVSEVWDGVKHNFMRMLGSTLAIAVVLAAGLLCCVVPGLYMLPALTLVPAIMVLEDYRFQYAFNRSFQLVKGKWGMAVGVWAVMYVIMMAAFFAASVPASVITICIKFIVDIDYNSIVGLVMIVATHLMEFFLILPVIATAILHFSLTELKDDVNLLKRINMLGQHIPDTDQHETEDY